MSQASNAAIQAGRARFARATGPLFSLAALAPSVWLLAFAWLVLKARLDTGHWPVPYQPDPGSVGGFLYTIVAGTLPLLYFLGLGGLLCLVVARSIPPLRAALRSARYQDWHLYVALFGMVMIALLVHVDPWRLATWLAD